MKVIIGLWMLMFSLASFAEDDVATLIKARNQQWEEAFNKGDIEGLSSIFGEGFIVIPPGSNAIMNRKDLKESLKNDMKILKDIRLETISLKVVEDYAYEIGRASYRLKDDKGEWAVSIDDYLVVWRKDNNVWNYYLDVYWPH